MSSVRIPIPEESILTRLLVSEVQRKIYERAYQRSHRLNRGRPAHARFAIRAEARAAHESEVCLRRSLLRATVRNACLDHVKQRIPNPATNILTYIQARNDEEGSVQAQEDANAAAEREMADAEAALEADEEAEAEERAEEARQRRVAQKGSRERARAFARTERLASRPAAAKDFVTKMSRHNEVIRQMNLEDREARGHQQMSWEDLEARYTVNEYVDGDLYGEEQYP